MERNPVIVSGRPDVRESTLATHKVLRNTYLLLSATLAFSALVAGVSYSLNFPYLGPWVTLIGYFALLFAVRKTADSAWGLLSVFALTGFMGYTLGPILSLYVRAIPDGHSVVMTAFGITAATFLALSAYAIRSGSRFSFMGGFLAVGILTAFLLGIVAARAIARGIRGVRAADGGAHPVRDRRDNPRRRDELHSRDRDAVRQHLQPVHQPAAPARRRRRRLITRP
jgi:hypothetical protein